MSTNNVIELLVKLGVLDDRQHDAVMSRSRSAAGGDLVRQVADLGYATESTVARILSVELGLPRVDLSMTPPEHEALSLLDLKTCLDRFVLPVALRENGELLWLAMGDPTDAESMALVRRKAGKRVRPVVAGPSEITREARKLYAAPQTPGHFQNLDDTQLDHGPMEPIELGEQAHGQEEAFEIVNVADESAAPLERLAEQLGVAVPESMSRRSREPEPAGPSSAGGGAGYGELEIYGADAADDGATLLEARAMVFAQPVQPPPPSSRSNLAATGQRAPSPSAARTTQPGAPPFQPRPPSALALQAQGEGPPPPPSMAPLVRAPAPPSATRVPAPGGPVTAPMRSPLPNLPARSGPLPAPRPVPPSVSFSATPPVSAAKSTVVQRGVRVAQMGGENGAARTGPQRPVNPDARPLPPAAPPAQQPALQQGALEAVFAVPAAHGPAQGPLAPEDVVTLEALRTSMEKGALVLRAIAELCVDKGVFTREEMKNRAK